jgi:hypothetical protein
LLLTTVHARGIRHAIYVAVCRQRGGTDAKTTRSSAGVVQPEKAAPKCGPPATIQGREAEMRRITLAVIALLAALLAGGCQNNMFPTHYEIQEVESSR